MPSILLSLVFVLLCICPFSVKALLPAEESHISEKSLTIHSVSSGFRGAVWQSPALHYYHSPCSWTDIQAGGRFRDKGRATWSQLGDKDSHIGVDVNTFVILSEKSRVYGKAGYSSEEAEHVLWNENLDWEIVAPYVTGDSVGGFLKGETYYFSGAYATARKDWTIGVAGSYRAAHNYRDKDPRPRNTASDLTVTLGGAYRLGAYRIGLAADIRSYQQRSDISFLADIGSYSVYHMLGLGMDYVRFAGTYTSTQYNGLQWGGQLSVLPVDIANGISASLSLKHMSLDKKLPTANHLTLLNLGTTTWEGNVTWMRHIHHSDYWGVKIDGQHLSRHGKEYAYGEGAGGTYGTLIGSSSGVKITHTRMGIKGLAERRVSQTHKWGGAVLPAVSFNRFEIDYPTVARHIKATSLETMLALLVQFQKNKLRVTAEAKGGYHSSLSSSYALPGINMSKSSSVTLFNNIAWLTDSFSTFGIGFRAEHPIVKLNIVYLHMKWQTQHYKVCGHTNDVEAAIGFIF